MKLSLAFFLPIIFISTQVWSAERTGQARLFLGSTQVKPTDLNAELTNQQLKNVDLNNLFGIEITFPVMSSLNLGLRYAKRIIAQDELNSDPNTNFSFEAKQDAMAAVARVAFYKNEHFVVDAVLGAGGSNTESKIKTASQDGELTKKGSPFATPFAIAGISMGVGAGKYFFVIESGIESHKVSGFSRSGNVNSNVNDFDLSGTYLTVGLMFDGIPIYSK